MTIRTIVVATDGSPGGTRAVEWTGDLADQVGGAVLAVHVFEPLAHLGEVEPPVDFTTLEAGALNRLRTKWCRALNHRGIAYEAVVVEGDPAEAIRDSAIDRGADLIVIGARGLSGLRRLVMGSTSDRLLRISDLPVVVIPTPHEE